MGSSKFHKFLNFTCRNSVWILAFSWVCSICIGLLLGSYFDPDVLSLMRTASSSRVSIVGLLLNLLFPVVLSAVAVRFSFPGFQYFLAVGKGLCHGICMYMILGTFSSAGWLLFRLLLFSDSCLLIPLFYFWIRHIDGSRDCLLRDTRLCLYVAIAAVVIDCFFVAPLITASIIHS